MGNTLGSLNNIRMLRAEAQDIDSPTLEDMLDRLSTVVEECRMDNALQQIKLSKRKEKIEAIRAKLLAEGITPEELLMH